MTPDTDQKQQQAGLQATRQAQDAKAKAKAKAYEAGPQYDEGDPAKGKLDPEEQAILTSGTTIPIRDRRAYLLDQAAKNESANDELNARQVEANKKLGLVMAEITDPDRMRDESMESAIEEIDRHTVEYANAARASRQEAMRTMHLRAGGFHPEDSFIAGPPPAALESAAQRKAPEK
jgi:hypothetical protein